MFGGSVVACNTSLMLPMLAPITIPKGHDQHADLLVTHRNLGEGTGATSAGIEALDASLLTELLKGSFQGSEEVSWHQQIYLTGYLPETVAGTLQTSRAPFKFSL